MSTAKQNGAKRTGRAALVRDFLGRQRTAKTAREILDAVEPGGNINLMTATLGTLLRGGAVEKHGAGLGQVRWLIARYPQRSQTETARPAKRISVDTRAAPMPRSVPNKAASTSQSKASKTIVQPTRAPNREQKTNFTAPLSTVAAPAKPSTTAGFESVDDFLRRGGRIQVLRAGECSQPLRYDHSHHDEQRAKGRATQQRNRAAKRA
ncbi:hypothetical protein [Stenotrophomonas pigmentata]|uniref:hypothetical protein n=1 Tax=Stenotrophomonas pigmentata TaxID=3055080 RepID=UPI0026F14027|nr:hypothetical protein [Stenotrophomonas sp. 610A2]